MKISKRSIFFAFLFIVLALLVVGAYKAITFINDSWNDESTWSVADRMVFPKPSEDIRLTIKGSLYDGDFSVDLPYCQLYSVVSANDKTTLYCSLLSGYYKIDRSDTIKIMSETADIKLSIVKTDPAPTSYLDRIDTSFESVSLFGAESVPVSLHLEGHATKPEKSLQALIMHAQKVYKNEKESIPVAITKWSVNSLNAASEATRSAYAKRWKDELLNELNGRISSTEMQYKAKADFLNILRDKFKLHLMLCDRLNRCSYTGSMNPAEPVMYYLYSQRVLNKQYYEKAKADITTSMYPFVSKTVSESGNKCTGENCVKDWTEMSATYFPICPVNDLMNGTQSDEFTNLFSKYVQGRSKTPLLAVSDVSALLEKYDKASVTADPDSYPLLASDMNAVCYFLITKGPNSYPELKKKYLSIYSALLSTLIGSPVTLTKTGIIDAIYKNTAYSAYNSNYILDSNLPTNLKKFGVIAADPAVLAHSEVRTFFGTVILLYLYNGFAN